MQLENYSIPKGKNLFAEITKLAEKEKLFHANILAAKGKIVGVKIIPTDFNPRQIPTAQEFGLAKLTGVIKKTQTSFSFTPLKATIFNPENPKITIDGELRAATTASEITIDISKHDLSKIIS
jgi:predicted DNA-binding protein with PD1-like motif